MGIKERIIVDSQTNIVLVKYKSSEFLIANNQKDLLLLKEYESEPDIDVYQSFVIIPLMKLIHKFLKCLNFSVLTYLSSLFSCLDIVAQVNIYMGALSNTEGFSSSLTCLLLCLLLP